MTAVVEPQASFAKEQGPGRVRHLLHQCGNAAALLADQPSVIRQILSWRRFSLSSYRILSAFACEGIVPATILDVGANIGQFAYAAAKFFPQAQIHAFEPVSDTVRLLRKNVRGVTNITVHEVALGPAEGRASMHINADSHASSLLPIARTHAEAFPAAREMGTTEVEMSTLDREVGMLQPRGPVLLKLDVQGFEHAVLRGAQKALERVDAIIAETSFTPMYAGEVVFQDLSVELANAGFSFARPLSWLTHPRRPQILQMDALFLRMQTRVEGQ